MKLQELLETAAYMKEMDEKQRAEYDELMDEYKEMSMRERRETYKPFGKLGKLTKPEQVLRHKIFGTKKHHMVFDAEFRAGRRGSLVTEYKCIECGKVIRQNQKGNRVDY
jgi:hypothetical protein